MKQTGRLCVVERQTRPVNTGKVTWLDKQTQCDKKVSNVTWRPGESSFPHLEQFLWNSGSYLLPSECTSVLYFSKFKYTLFYTNVVFRPRLNIVIFLPILGWKYSCISLNYSLWHFLFRIFWSISYKCLEFKPVLPFRKKKNNFFIRLS